MGDTGREAMNQRVSYSAPGEDGSVSANEDGEAAGMNRAERRAAKRRR